MSDLNKLEERISKLSRLVDVETGKRNMIMEQRDSISKEIEKLDEEREVLEKVILLFQKTAEYARIQAKNQVEDLVTKCLQFIFETDIRFSIELSESRNIPSAEFFVESDYEGYKIKTKPEIARGGGIVDVISIALRIAFLEIHNPKIKGPLLLDEPGKHLSDDYVFNLGEFLRKSSEMFNRQIIMVTHNSYLSQISDNSLRVEIKKGKSVIAKPEE